MTPGYEEAVYEKAQNKQKAMRRAIQSTDFELFKPQSALIPIHGLVSFGSRTSEFYV